MERTRIASRLGLAATVAAGLGVASCGGGERQDKHEKSATYTVEIVRKSFPAKQSLAKPAQLVLVVRNTGHAALPNVAVTVDSFSTRSQQPGLADPERPVWIVDAGPQGGTTAYVNTWALGPLRPGQTKTFKWNVTAVVPGTHEVKWRVAAGLNGKAKAQLAGGDEPAGSFPVEISGKPSQSHVDPETGAVVREDDS